MLLPLLKNRFLTSFHLFLNEFIKSKFNSHNGYEKSLKKRLSTEAESLNLGLISQGCLRKDCGFSYQLIICDIALFRASFRLFLIEINNEMEDLVKNQMK